MTVVGGSRVLSKAALAGSTLLSQPGEGLFSLPILLQPHRGWMLLLGALRIL